MTCVHKVRWSVKRPEDCRFRLSVSRYKDRIVAPDEYSGVTVVTPSDSEQVLPTKDKTVRSDIVINPAPTETLSATSNGSFTPSSGKVGFSEVNVDVPIPTFETEEKTVTENGVYYPSAGKDGISKVTVDVPSQAPVLDSLSVTENGTYTPSAGIDGFNEVVVDVPTGGSGGLTLLDTIEVTGVRGVQVDINTSWFDDADYVLLVPDLTFSASDWMYIVADATSGGNDYAPRATSVGISQGVTLGIVSDHVVGAWFKDGTNRPSAYTPQSYLYWYLYYASTTMTGTIKIYGIKVTS